MIEKKIEITSENGLHARPSAQIARVSSGFVSQIQIGFNATMVNAKSIMGLLTLAASMGSILVLRIDGDDEAEATAALMAEIVPSLGKEVE